MGKYLFIPLGSCAEEPMSEDSHSGLVRLGANEVSSNELRWFESSIFRTLKITFDSWVALKKLFRITALHQQTRKLKVRFLPICRKMVRSSMVERAAGPVV